jgi:hypothetical protein
MLFANSYINTATFVYNLQSTNRMTNCFTPQTRWQYFLQHKPDDNIVLQHKPDDNIVLQHPTDSNILLQHKTGNTINY